MNDSKKLIVIRIVIALIIIMFISLFIFLIIKIDIFGIIFSKDSLVRTSTSSNLIRYIDKLNDREFTDIKREGYYIEQVKETKAIEVDEKSIFKYINAVKNNKKNLLSIINNNNVLNNQNITSISTKSEIDYKVKQELNKIQSIYDKGYYKKSSWLFIDDDLDYYSYNYYFDEKGKLIYDTVAPDYRIVDKYGREVDDDLLPILYKINKESNIVSTPNEIEKGYLSTQVIISPSANIKDNITYYDNKMNRRVIDYIDSSLRFKKTTNGTIYDGSKWKSVSSLRNDSGYVIFNNPKNNFNKIIGKITTQQIKDNEDTNLILLVYDADLYELYKGYEYMLEPLYETEAFNGNEPLDFSFTFYRTVKRLRFQIESYDNEKPITCYLKDLRFGFNKQKYKEELKEAKENEEYIKYLKELGLYKNDEEILEELKLLEEDSQSDYLEYEDFKDIDFYKYVDLSNYDKEQRAIDRRTGPAFDEYLRSLKNFWEIEYGPAFTNN